MNTIQYVSKSLRDGSADPLKACAKVFKDVCGDQPITDAVFLSVSETRLLGCMGMQPGRPILSALLNDAVVGPAIGEHVMTGTNGLLIKDRRQVRFVSEQAGRITEVPLDSKVLSRIQRIFRESAKWVGKLTNEGDYEFDPRTPSPGTHFRANLLIGDRAGFPHPLMTTPKALVDEWGRGSSRSHADRQILATRWDVVPEENGFPANRQFYLVEHGRQFFYSAAPDPRVKVTTRHAANRTVMVYHLPDGLEIERTIFILPAEAGLPLGVEAQLIRLRNGGVIPRNIKVVVTGMFGCPVPDALVVDVIYTCVTTEPRVLVDAQRKAPVVVSPRYSQAWCQDDHPFHMSTLFDAQGRATGPDEFCLNYRRFIGNGSLEKPQHVAHLDNVPPPKGPAFFALSLPCHLQPGEEAESQSFTGMVSRHEGEMVTEQVLASKLERFAARASDPAWCRNTLAKVADFHDRYCGAVQIESPDKQVNRLVNTHLPFQIRYQTYVSRSFALTQKGFRKIGFREIQDLFAALPFEMAAGRQTHVRDLIGLWAGHVHRFGYADHQFYWTGYEPGRYSDDALWLFQAVGRYIDITGDYSILQTEWPVAGEEIRRPLLDTLQAILEYSGKISIGKNGLPLIDHADWNDTLNLDGEGLHGPEKEKRYRQQVAEGRIAEGDALESDLSESVMNGFLLEIARAYMVRFAAHEGAHEIENEWQLFGPVLAERLQKAWKGDFFCRAFLNRPNAAGATYLGGQGDGLSADPKLPGTYFLNSFSWSVLSGVATDDQIRVMLDRMEQTLVTPFGIRLASPTDYHRIMPQVGSGDYLYGDRENGAVFKHATMMGASALIRAARQVADPSLAKRLQNLAWRVLRATAPFKTFENPYKLAGNPRFCTQYTNPVTEEHIGPLLSGTAPWMWMTYLDMMGVQFVDGCVRLDPVLPAEWRRVGIRLRVPAGEYDIAIEKPARFVRSRETPPVIRVGESEIEPVLPAVEGKPLQVSMRFA